MASDTPSVDPKAKEAYQKAGQKLKAALEAVKKMKAVVNSHDAKVDALDKALEE
jgi:hypothetical protein